MKRAGKEMSSIKVKTLDDHHLAGWKAIQNVIKNEVPSTPAESAFLMETMSDLAAEIDKRKGVKTEYGISMPYKKWRGVWYCLDVCAHNKMYVNQGQQAMMLQMQIKIAETLDVHVAMEEAPKLKLVQ